MLYSGASAGLLEFGVIQVVQTLKGRALSSFGSHVPSYYNGPHLRNDTLRAMSISDRSFGTETLFLFIRAGIHEGRRHP